VLVKHGAVTHEDGSSFILPDREDPKHFGRTFGVSRIDFPSEFLNSRRCFCIKCKLSDVYFILRNGG
jgi:hypothetical protein